MGWDGVVCIIGVLVLQNTIKNVRNFLHSNIGITKSMHQSTKVCRKDAVMLVYLIELDYAMDNMARNCNIIIEICWTHLLQLWI